MKVIVALDSFKGCLTSEEANRAAAEGVLDLYPHAQVIQIPVSDGGEGWLEAFHAAIGGYFVRVKVCDPLGRPIMAEYLMKGKTAIIEIARASGLPLLKPEERDVERANTAGTGHLIVDAIRRGCSEIIVGLGGSATCDYGFGMTMAMQQALSKEQGWKEHVLPQLRGIRFVAATDVKNPLFGPNGAAYVFAPQKGATPEVVVRREAFGKHLASVVAETMGYDCSMREGAGAAGGLGWAMMQYLGAETTSGAELLLNRIGFNETILGADLIITGEGSADRQTLMGKLPYVIMLRARQQDVPCALISGRLRNRKALIEAGFSNAISINPPGIPLEKAIRKNWAASHIRMTVKKLGISRYKTDMCRFETRTHHIPDEDSLRIEP